MAQSHLIQSEASGMSGYFSSTIILTMARGTASPSYMEPALQHFFSVVSDPAAKPQGPLAEALANFCIVSSSISPVVPLMRANWSGG
jgi:hypothetical protein